MTIETVTILLPAFVAGLLVFAMHVPLGMEVLRRGIIFIDLAVAQIAALGVIVANIYLHAAPFWAEQGLALLFSVTGAWCFQYVESKAGQYLEAMIGASFVIASSVAVLLLANAPHGGEELENMLAGQILWVGWPQLGWAAIMCVAVLALWFTGKATRHFYTLFAITVTLSVQLVGVYLVFASLILPALATLRYERRLLAAYVLSLLSLMSGLLVSVLTDLPTGAVLVCTLAGWSLLSALFCHSKSKW